MIQAAFAHIQSAEKGSLARRIKEVHKDVVVILGLKYFTRDFHERKANVRFPYICV
jgi:hypothetical protein